LTLNDTKTAVNKLHRVLNILVAIGIFVVWLLILGIATSKFLLFVSSQLVLVAFIFGNTCKTVFEALVFLFVMHPYDVGDRCEIEGVQVIFHLFASFSVLCLLVPNLVFK
jgi:small-conductance mechanosensitive channel